MYVYIDLCIDLCIDDAKLVSFHQIYSFYDKTNDIDCVFSKKLVCVCGGGVTSSIILYNLSTLQFLSFGPVVYKGKLTDCQYWSLLCLTET